MHQGITVLLCILFKNVALIETFHFWRWNRVQKKRLSKQHHETKQNNNKKQNKKCLGIKWFQTFRSRIRVKKVLNPILLTIFYTL